MKPPRPPALPDIQTKEMDWQNSLDPKTLFHGVNTAQPVILAVSGGSDSISLLLLASAWATLKKIDLFAVTVDHGLRPEAASEAAFVAGVCETLEVTHVTLAWEGMKPSTGLSEASRKARYLLLEEFASEVGARTILCGHTADDQAETVFMRLDREKEGAESRGHSGMARVTLLSGGVRLVRPLLDVGRADLRQYLVAHAQSWIEDPTNQDMAYERVRVRKLLFDDPDYKSRLLDYSKTITKKRIELAKAAAVELGKRVTVKPGAVFHLKAGEFLALPEAVYLHVLQVLLATAGGNEYLPSTAKLGPVIEAIRNSNDVKLKQRLTLAGCIIEVKSDLIIVYREIRNLPATLLGPGETTYWDGRLLVTNLSATSLYIGPFEPVLLSETETRMGITIDVLPRTALGSMPIMRADGDELFLPTYGKRTLPVGVTARITSRAIETFCPEYDFALLEWLREIDLEASVVSRNHAN